VDDRQVEDLLKRYQPAGPPASLRTRCLAPLPVSRVWPWATAAAALLAITFALDAAAADATAGAGIVVAPDPAAKAVAELAETLGGDAAARQVAEQIVVEQVRHDREMAARATPVAGELP
jgi:hypothetical protein